MVYWKDELGRAGEAVQYTVAVLDDEKDFQNTCALLQSVLDKKIIDWIAFQMHSRFLPPYEKAGAFACTCWIF